MLLGFLQSKLFFFFGSNFSPHVGETEEELYQARPALTVMSYLPKVWYSILKTTDSSC